MKKNIFTVLAALIFALLGMAPWVYAEVVVENKEESRLTTAELEQLLAPVALYPDVLLAQILIAATYPLEVVQSQRWLQANPNLKGQDAAKKAAIDQDWDASIVALTAFPEVLQRMDSDLAWTQRLGEAFLSQEEDVMATVQSLREQAATAGNLKSTKQITVERDGPIIIIEPADPEVIYVPYYSTRVIYGGWRWAHYPPVYWEPYPGYHHTSVGFSWGIGTSFSSSYFYSRFYWPERHIVVVHRPTPVYSGPRYRHYSRYAENPRWQHEPYHRRGVNYSTRSLKLHATHSSATEPRRERTSAPQRIQQEAPVRPTQQWNGSHREQNWNRVRSPEVSQSDRSNQRGGSAEVQPRSRVRVPELANRRAVSERGTERIRPGVESARAHAAERTQVQSHEPQRTERPERRVRLERENPPQIIRTRPARVESSRQPGPFFSEGRRPPRIQMK